MIVLYKYINLGELEKLTTINYAFYVNWISADNTVKFSLPISLPRNIQHIGNKAFTNVYFGLLEIPESLTSIGSEALSRNTIDAIKFTRTDLSNISFAETAFNDGGHYNPNSFPVLLFPESVMEEYLSLDAFKKHDIVKGYKDEVIQAEHLDIYVNGKVIEEGAVIYANPFETIEFESSITPRNATIGEISFCVLESDDHPLSFPSPRYVPYEDGVYKYYLWHYNNSAAQDNYKHYVTCKTRDGSEVTRNFTISVYAQIRDIVFSESNISLEIGESKKLDFILSPTNVNTELINWESSNTNVATVDQYGDVTAVAVGDATITLSATDGSGVSAECFVSVVATPAAEIVLNTSSVELKATETVQLSATVLPETTTNKTVVWISSDESVAVVDQSGFVTALSEGECVITAKTTDGSELSATCEITVKKTEILVSSISLTPVSATGKTGEQIQISAAVLPENATNKTISWSSSDESIATVSDSGLVSLIKKGQAVITASATDESGVSAECAIIVSETSGIGDVLSDKSVYVRIFNMQGIQVYEGPYSEAKLAPDYYIVVCGGKSIKVKVE